MSASHGTYARYNSRTFRCRCGPCRYAAAVQRRTSRPHGDGDAVRAHIRDLSAAGIGYRRTAELAGVTLRTIARILYNGARPTAATAERVLAVSAAAGPAERWVPALGTARRLQALRAIGWANLQLAERLHLTQSSVSQVAMERRLTVRRATVSAVAEMYEGLAEVFPPMSSGESRNRTFARARLWFPPIAWEPETIDDPAGLPCLLPPVAAVAPDLELLVQHVVAGHPVDPTPEARAEIVRRMRGRRLADVAAAARCSTKRVSDLRIQMTGRSA